MQAKNTEFVMQLRELVEKKSLLHHPFYREWNMGKLSRETIQEYAKQYYYLESQFPTFLKHIHAQMNFPKGKKLVLENLNDETNGITHGELWLRFAEGLGVKRSEIKNVKLWKETKQMIHHYTTMAKKNPLQGLAALYAYEKQQPKVAKSKKMGLKQFYGVKTKRALEFFDVHEKADKWHSSQEEKMFATASAKEKKTIYVVLNQSLDTLNSFLDGALKHAI